MARDKAQEIAVVATAQDKAIGDSAGWYTLINDGPENEIFYRLKDKNTMGGTAAVVVATPIFGGRLRVNQFVHVPGGTWELCCATGLTATLRVLPGRVGNTGRIPLSRAAVDLAKNGTREIIAQPAAGHQIWIYGFKGLANAAGTVKLIDATPTDITGTMPVGANGGIDFKPLRWDEEPHFKCATAKAFQAVLSANVDLDGHVLYRDVVV